MEKDTLLRQIETLHEKEEHGEIIRLLRGLPPEELDYQLTCLLARAYTNLDDPEAWPEALRLLNLAAEEGREDPAWYFRLGGVHCRMATPEDKAKAEALFEQGFALLPPDSPEAADWHRRCDAVLAACQISLERQAAWDAYGDSLEPEKAQPFLRSGVLAGCFPVESRVEGDTIFLPKWQARLFPRVDQLSPRSAVLSLWMEAPQWGRELYECSAGMGQSPSQAIVMAADIFLSTFIQGLWRMEERMEPRHLTTAFAGRTHRWEVYPSDIAGLGAAPAPEGQPWWDLLGEDIARRLGNQKLCYVKIYGARMQGEITGECRIDDIKSEELSQAVARVVEKWPEAQFASQKQFIFLRQAEETTLPDPYLGPEGRNRLRAVVTRAAELFRQCRSEEDYDSYTRRLGEEIGDMTLAAECLSFLPELCAENAFQQLQVAETVEIRRDGLPPEVVYKNQLADYYPLRSALQAIFTEGIFGTREENNALYRKYIGYSATGGVVQQLRQQGSPLEGCRMEAMLYRVGADFEIR